MSGFDLDVEPQCNDCLLLLSEGEEGESDCDDSQTESDSDRKTDINKSVNFTNTYLCSYVSVTNLPTDGRPTDSHTVGHDCCACSGSDS